ncbi:TPA: zinc-finger domain-containing protein [Bacillus cereus]|uniref:zinc-finger domain-containing protein n=1 Tax=Bacillus thuringiensis TaxID=1428 RepID=UPI00119E9724|nr:zinc-finger domain-containing protein [Bacillus thuringiensis]HEF1857352.1 zinc-finger domain-containing protein [Bacillus cereus]HEF1869696.1 zinc-finger domain-containing protein [Bacillus cereus]HEF1878095.1 zinc-finger domain-containing protein [Bacillus cereus]HEF1886345.1 zinc-finger domain-containing protein [Bacillus cereus]
MKRDKKSIRIHILDLQDENCTGCKRVPAYRKSGNRKTSWCADNCRIGKRIKQLGETLLEGRNETMAEQMAEERNWDVLCEKAEKLREQKLSWAKIADRLGVSESTLYHNVAKRREKKEGMRNRAKRSGTKKSIKPLAQDAKVVREKNEHSEERDNGMHQTELKAELEKVKEQFQNREEEYTTLLHERNQLSEKKWELEAELRKVQIRVGAAEETAERERKHRLECQARAQALGIALKAVL